MTKTLLIHLCAICTIASNTPILNAQRSLSIDVAVNGGEGHGGEYVSRRLNGGRLSIAVRESSAVRGFGRYVEVGVDDLSGPRSSDAICMLSVGGGCVPDYPAFFGAYGSAGVLIRPLKRLEVRVGGGAGVYNAYRGQTVGAVLGQLDVAAFPAQRLGLVAGRRGVLVPYYRGDRLYEFPWVFGLRFR